MIHYKPQLLKVLNANWKINQSGSELQTKPKDSGEGYVSQPDLESNDSYGTLGLDQETTSPPHSRYLHGSATPPYMSSPTHPPLPYNSETYSTLGVQGTTAPSEISDGSSTHGYPDFPPSPDSWLGENAAHRY